MLETRSTRLREPMEETGNSREVEVCDDQEEERARNEDVVVILCRGNNVSQSRVSARARGDLGATRASPTSLSLSPRIHSPHECWQTQMVPPR
jgi:hypothetical protein